jgi:DNA-binding GntR family transcriptional regulator
MGCAEFHAENGKSSASLKCIHFWWIAIIIASMDSSTHTGFIVESLTRAIVEHRLQPGEKLAEQTLATQFGVSRTLIRQALFRLSQNRLIRMEPARGAFVAAPSINEARQVFAVRRMLEAGMVRSFIQNATAEHFSALAAHVTLERAAVDSADVHGRNQLVGDFHVCMAQLMGNEVLEQLLTDLISRSALITLMYQSAKAAQHSHQEHAAIVAALHARNEALALQLMESHLHNVEQALTLSPPALTAKSERP